jgi:hypothetical protein
VNEGLSAAGETAAKTVRRQERITDRIKALKSVLCDIADGPTRAWKGGNLDCKSMGCRNGWKGGKEFLIGDINQSFVVPALDGLQ